MKPANAIRKRLREKVREMLEVIELEGEEKKMPVNLSGGMKKRVGLARSIIRRPSCVLYDEPTAGLDPVVSDSINQLIRRLQKRFGVTSIVVTHDMKSAFHIADHIAYLHEGRIYFYGTPQELEISQRPINSGFYARTVRAVTRRNLADVARTRDKFARARSPGRKWRPVTATKLWN